MMLGVSGLMGSSGDGAATAAEAHDSGGSSEVGGSSSILGGCAVEESGGGGSGGNRWPRQETLALLKIRSAMDAVFRDASLKGPLWEEVSRKMAELGFQRSSKKCKEKFENVYKYHKRTKDGRASKTDGKTYRFFDQLEALENTSPNPFTPPPPRPQPHATTTTAALSAPTNIGTNVPMPSHVTVSSSSPTPLTIIPPQNTNSINISSPFQQPIQPPITNASKHPYASMSFLSNSTSSSTSSDEDIRRRGRKRKWKEYFERLMREVITKQEDLQKRFLDALEKRERDRMVRQEAWRVQETARINREHELLVQERSMAAAKDAALIAFLQKFDHQNNLQIPFGNNNNNNTPQVQPMQVQQPENPQPLRQAPPPPSPPPPPPAQPQSTTVITPTKTDNGGDNFMIQASSSRWPKAEVEDLIKLRTNLDLKYQDNGPKGPLWEEISAAMGKLGYNRSAKRCKEKWENINKYFKKAKESNKKRPEDSKTCPYFHQLDAIYKERAKNDVAVQSFNPGYPNPMAPIMARPEQQWPLPEQKQHDDDTVMHDNESDQNNDHEEDEEEDGGGYEIIANKQQSSLTNTVE